LRFGGEKMPRYIEENEIYKLFNPRGVAQLHVGDIDALPRADVVEVVHGRWVYEPVEFTYEKDIRCSVCGEYVNSATNHCPNCGAKMDKSCVSLF
jgi:rubrerythrin